MSDNVRPSSESGNGSQTAAVEWVRAEVSRRLSSAANTNTSENAAGMSARERAELGRRFVIEALDSYTARQLHRGRAPLDERTEQQVGTEVINSLFAMGGFQPLLNDPDIENINANGCDRVYVRYADGRREAAPPVANSDEELIELIRTIAARSGVEERRFDRGSPGLSVQLPDGSRLFAVMAVAARPAVAIRRHRFLAVTLADLVRLGTIDPDLRRFLQGLVRARKNVVICGGTAMGKTTLLRALAAEIPPWERLITIEDSYELALDHDPDLHPDVVALQARQPNVEGEGEVPLAELVRWALRMSPDRVIVGEARGIEVVPMLNAMSQGNDGTMTTLHASSSRIAFTKLAAYAAQAAERLPLEASALLIGSAVHFVVHLAYDTSGTRVVSSIREVVDADGPQVVSNEIYRPGPDRRAARTAVPVRGDTLDDLIAAGYDPEAGPRR
ncbi:MAG TPA: ATPase, T2SS/T4P/T4SS family [Streptosporangiaceae bacterium]|jgi:Flp pilus assembly CpaF family ATPase